MASCTATQLCTHLSFHPSFYICKGVTVADCRVAFSFAISKPYLQVKLPSKQAGAADTGVEAKTSKLNGLQLSPPLRAKVPALAHA